jgi:hypothetical protein
VIVDSWGPNVTVPTKTQKAALAVAQEYVDNAVLLPLDNGAAGSGYSALFDPPLRRAATGVDARALTDIGFGKVNRYVEANTPVTINALADGSGHFVYLATRFTAKANITIDGTHKAALTREIELTLAPVGKGWRIVAYRVNTVRKVGLRTTTTTAARSSTTTTGSTP